MSDDSDLHFEGCTRPTDHPGFCEVDPFDAESIRAPRGLTDDEHRAMDITVELVNQVCQKVIGRGPTREHDVSEFVDKIHQIQVLILSQAAGRAHPDRYRLLGQTITSPLPPDENQP